MLEPLKFWERETRSVGADVSLKSEENAVAILLQENTMVTEVRGAQESPFCCFPC